MVRGSMPVKVEGWATGGSMPASKEGWVVRGSMPVKVEGLGDHDPGKELRRCQHVPVCEEEK